MFYGCLCVYPRSLWMWYVTNCLGEFHQIFNLVHLSTEISWLDFDIKRSRVKVMLRQNMAKVYFLGPFCQHRTLSDGGLKWIGSVTAGSAVLVRMRSKGQRLGSQPYRILWSKKAEVYALSASHHILSRCSEHFPRTVVYFKNCA